VKTAIKINGQSVEIPNEWSEVTFGQFLRLKDADTDAKILAAITGFDVELCEQIDADYLNAILLPIAKLGEVPTVDNPLICGKVVPDNIGRMEYARKINCDSLGRKYDNEEAIGRMVAVYLADGIEDEDIDEMYNKVLNEPLPDVIGAGKLLSDQLNKLRESEEKIPSPQYESEELRAGIKDFAKYGVFGLVRGIALRYGCKIEEIYNWSYNSVLLELRYSSEESAYQRKLNRILSKK